MSKSLNTEIKENEYNNEFVHLNRKIQQQWQIKYYIEYIEKKSVTWIKNLR